MKRFVLAAMLIVATFTAVGLRRTYSQPGPDDYCNGPFSACVPFTCLLEEQGGFGTCQDNYGNVNNYYSMKTTDLQQYGCASMPGSSCNEIANVNVCYGVFSRGDYCPPDNVACSGFFTATSCNP